MLITCSYDRPTKLTVQAQSGILHSSKFREMMYMVFFVSPSPLPLTSPHSLSPFLFLPAFSLSASLPLFLASLPSLTLYVYVYAYIYVRVCMCVCVYVSAHVCASTCVSLCVYAYMYVSLW